MQFKVGDIVKLTRDTDNRHRNALKKGDIGKITNYAGTVIVESSKGITEIGTSGVIKYLSWKARMENDI